MILKRIKSKSFTFKHSFIIYIFNLINGRIQNFMKLSQLSYSFVFMYKDRLIAVRDPFGNRPLCIGKICNNEGKGYFNAF